MEKAKISGLKIENFKRVKLVEIQPGENGLTIIGGRNAQGKSSVLDAIAYALGGEAFRPSEVTNDSAEANAAIRVEIDGLIIERGGKNAALKVTDARGMKGSQTLLNDVVSKFALNLGAFMRASDSDKAKMLLQMRPELKTTLAGLKDQAEKVREDRADVNRDIKRLQFQFDGMEQYPDLPAEEISLTELLQKQAAAAQEERVRFEAQKELDELQRQLEDCEQRGCDAKNRRTNADNALFAFEEEVKQQRVKLQAAINQADSEYIESCKQWEDLSVAIDKKRTDILANQSQTGNDADSIRAEIAQVGETNAKIRKNQERRGLYGQIENLKKNADGKSKELDDIEQKRTELLRNAELPLPGLSINDEGELLYNGKKWDCMSGSERLKVATAICMEDNPKCGFVLIDGLEAMDAETLREFKEFLSERKMQGIGTIVGGNDAQIIIEDGEVIYTQNSGE